MAQSIYKSPSDITKRYRSTNVLISETNSSDNEILSYNL